MTNDQQHINVFIAYSRKDTSYLEKLQTYLQPLHRNQTIKIWYDGEIAPGTVWEDAIKTQLHQADIILLLVSADSLASNYFYEKEMEEALERHNRGETIVVPVILRDCTWELTELKHLQALPQDGKPIVHWSNESTAYANVVRGLYRSIELVQDRRMDKNKIIQQTEEEKKATEQKQAQEVAEQKRRTEQQRQQALARQRQQEAAQKQRQKSISQNLQTASNNFAQGSYKKTIAAANAVLKLDAQNPQAQQLKTDATAILKEQQAENLDGLKSKLFKFGIPAMLLMVVLFALSKIDCSSGGDFAGTGNENIEMGNDEVTNNSSSTEETPKETPKETTKTEDIEPEKTPQKTTEQKYRDLINEANALYLNDEYAKAKKKYQAAQKIKPKGKTAKSGIAKCNKALKPAPIPHETVPRITKITTPQYSTPIQAIINNMVTISGGTFTMGCTSEQKDCGSDEKPKHSVTLRSFKISKYELTQEQWRAVMGSDPPELKFKGCDKCPVERVSWDDIQKFIKKLNQKTGKKFRLPTEAEWEYAARGGKKSKGYQYAGGNTLGDVAWWSENSNGKTHPVGGKQPNELGLYDMSGNVWEWCEDKWHDDYKGAPSNGSAWVSGSSSYRVIRGGSWCNNAYSCRVANRYYNSTVGRYNYIGFRLASSL